MAEQTEIAWTDATFNGWIGCTKVSPACDNCYAETLSSRWMGVTWGAGQERRRTSESNWRLPLRWNRKAEKDGKRLKVFCSSLADVFDTEVQQSWRDDLFSLIDETPQLDWLLLTKRPNVARKLMPETVRPNVWLGTTVENESMVRARIPLLLDTPAALRFVSVEPLLGPVNLLPYLHGLDWVIVGGESGHGARVMNPEWVRSVRDQCEAAGTPFLFKQWGEWAPAGTEMVRAGKKAAGRLLDGVLHDAFPSIEA